MKYHIYYKKLKNNFEQYVLKDQILNIYIFNAGKTSKVKALTKDYKCIDEMIIFKTLGKLMSSILIFSI